MQITKVFISSVQKEFANERIELSNWIKADPLLGQFFEPFLFEQVPAENRTAQHVFLEEIKQSGIYLGLLGNKYGFIGKKGVSVTEEEFDEATKLGKTRLVYVSNGLDSDREDRQIQFILKAQSALVRKRFSSLSDLKTSIYASLIHYLQSKGAIQHSPFDVSIQLRATTKDLNPDRIRWFISRAKSKRGFKLDVETSIHDFLMHLNLIQDTYITNAALLLFGKEPQRFFFKLRG
jgi:hypothetical protein